MRTPSTPLCRRHKGSPARHHRVRRPSLGTSACGKPIRGKNFCFASSAGRAKPELPAPKWTAGKNQLFPSTPRRAPPLSGGHPPIDNGEESSAPPTARAGPRFRFRMHSGSRPTDHGMHPGPASNPRGTLPGAIAARGSPQPNNLSPAVWAALCLRYLQSPNESKVPTLASYLFMNQVQATPATKAATQPIVLSCTVSRSLTPEAPFFFNR